MSFTKTSSESATPYKIPTPSVDIEGRGKGTPNPPGPDIEGKINKFYGDGQSKNTGC